ncbi:MAG: response regulator transcription factor [Nakamurella sp.]
MQPIRVFLLDDHEIVRRGIVALLNAESDIEVVAEASGADEARVRVSRTKVDVAVLDARLPDGSGIDVCRDIRSEYPEIRCLILTSYDDDEALVAAVLAGADAYLLKEIRGDGLVRAIRSLAAGRSLLDPRVTGPLLERLRDTDTRDTKFDTLTDREKSVLSLITEGLTNRQIGNRLFLAEKTIKNHVSSLLAKLDMDRRTQVAVYGAENRRSE